MKCVFLIIIIFIFSSIFCTEVDDTNEEQLLEGIIKGLKELKIPFNSTEDIINQDQYFKLFNHLILNDIGNLGGLPSSFLIEPILDKLKNTIFKDLPKEVKIKDLPKYLNPRLIEPMVNDLLNEIDFTSIIKNIGSTLGIDKKIEDTLKRREEAYQEKLKKDQIRKNSAKNKTENKIHDL